jgi:hypothetical protein
MTAPIPREARQRVWEMYLGGKSFQLIEDVTGVSKASVVNIVRDMGGYDPDHILMRALAVNLRKNGSDLSQYASAIRISSLLDEYGVDYATGEELLGKFLSTCYKLHWDPSVAVHALRQFLASAERYGHTPIEHANYFNKLHSSEESLHLRNFRERKKLRELIQKYDIVKDNLDVFLSEDGVESLIVNKKLTTIEIESEIKALKNDALLHQQHKSIDADELSRLNESLIISVSEQEVLDKLEDIRRHPSIYSNLFDKHIPTGPNSIAGASAANATGIELEDSQNLNQKEISINQN